MSLVHIHLMTNHIPVIGTVLGLVLLAVGIVWESNDLKKFTLYYFVALGALSLLVFFTGEPAEDAVEQLAGVSKAAIERHEDASIFALIGIEVIAALSFAGLLFKRTILFEKRWYPRGLFGLIVITTAVMAWVANLGGQIRHSEISSDQSAGVAGYGDDDR
jgi:hypothetical protein